MNEQFETRKLDELLRSNFKLDQTRARRIVFKENLNAMKLEKNCDTRAIHDKHALKLKPIFEKWMMQEL